MLPSMCDKRMRLSVDQMAELNGLADKASNLSSLLRGAAQLGEKGHPVIVAEIDAAFKELKQIVDRVRRFIECL